MPKYTFRSLLPSEDFFAPENDPIDHAFIDRYSPIIEALSKYFRPTYHGLENVPREGPALLVGNHGVIGFDGFFIFLAIYRATGRLPRGLGDYHLFMEPLSRRFWTKAGAIVGKPDVALAYLRAGNLVNVYPGGARDAMKGPEGKYHLHWERSFGFVRLAMRANVPVVLHMGVGTDDTYRILGKMKWTGKVMGHPKYAVPLYMGWGLLPPGQVRLLPIRAHRAGGRPRCRRRRRGGQAEPPDALGSRARYAARRARATAVDLDRVATTPGTAGPIRWHGQARWILRATSGLAVGQSAGCGSVFIGRVW